MIANVLLKSLSSSTFENLHRTVEVPYTQGKWSAVLGSDIITIRTDGDPLVVRAEVACITESSEFFMNGSQWEGILGLGYDTISQVCSFLITMCNRVLRTLFFASKITVKGLDVSYTAVFIHLSEVQNAANTFASPLKLVNSK